MPISSRRLERALKPSKGQIRTYIAAFLIALYLLWGCTVPDPKADSKITTESVAVDVQLAAIPAEAEEAEVVRVIDGDTIVVYLDGSEYKVRYILIDTPERDEPLYNEATKLNQLLIGRQTIYLVKDESETDRYDRLLRYIYTQDGLLVNAELVRQGMARVAVFPPDTRLLKEIRSAEAEAKEREIGIWN